MLRPDIQRMRRALAAWGLMLAVGASTAVAQAALPEAPTPQTKPEEKKLLIGPANCVSPAYAATNSEAASGALVESKPCTRQENPFNRFLSTSAPHPMTPAQKLLLALTPVIRRLMHGVR